MWKAKEEQDRISTHHFRIGMEEDEEEEDEDASRKRVCEHATATSNLDDESFYPNIRSVEGSINNKDNSQNVNLRDSYLEVPPTVHFVNPNADFQNEIPGYEDLEERRKRRAEYHESNASGGSISLPIYRDEKHLASCAIRKTKRRGILSNSKSLEERRNVQKGSSMRTIGTNFSNRKQVRFKTGDRRLTLPMTNADQKLAAIHGWDIWILSSTAKHSVGTPAYEDMNSGSCRVPETAEHSNKNPVSIERFSPVTASHSALLETIERDKARVDFVAPSRFPSSTRNANGSSISQGIQERGARQAKTQSLTTIQESNDVFSTEEEEQLRKNTARRLTLPLVSTDLDISETYDIENKLFSSRIKREENSYISQGPSTRSGACAPVKLNAKNTVVTSNSATTSGKMLPQYPNHSSSKPKDASANSVFSKISSSEGLLVEASKSISKQEEWGRRFKLPVSSDPSIMEKGKELSAEDTSNTGGRRLTLPIVNVDLSLTAFHDGNPRVSTSRMRDRSRSPTYEDILRGTSVNPIRKSSITNVAICSSLAPSLLGAFPGVPTTLLPSKSEDMMCSSATLSNLSTNSTNISDEVTPQARSSSGRKLKLPFPKLHMPDQQPVVPWNDHDECGHHHHHHHHHVFPHIHVPTITFTAPATDGGTSRKFNFGIRRHSQMVSPSFSRLKSNITFLVLRKGLVVDD
ncbi:hypothetical protein KM043_016277 [Ampulex compressa]|nr:hypothetical protein KM043_016277 [Ampulex compressa]